MIEQTTKSVIYTLDTGKIVEKIMKQAGNEITVTGYTGLQNRLKQKIQTKEAR